ncbi:DUF3500 domain-containing protein [Kribbella jejuensis]|uniref:Uncharacterized protein DUF3500 n=1 Tax=Kribbella jejuensis TaxID=236068 RepID=A0A542D9M1_9ACTN|nr:DUF3500 domain-containing protein [Kribbella jejuensis]TQI99766.1 uncharacterized protein DUF3500 [Kribbella jejuensis]
MVVAQTREAVLDLLASLSPAQLEKLKAPFDTPDHKEWTYLPGDRPGLPLGDLTPAQQLLAKRLVELCCSERGAADSWAVLDAEVILRGIPALPESGDWQGTVLGERFFLRVLGDPSGTGPWAWRLNGHHLALHVTFVDGAVSFTPQFIGSNPAEVLSGPETGRRFLAAEQDLGFQLLHALEPGQLEIALVSPDAPDDILTRHDPVADASVLHRGLLYGDMNEQQRQLLSLLIGQYVGRAAGPIGLQTWQDITEQGIERLTFAWAGETEPGVGHRHYYSIAGPTFLAEYDNTQDNANHIHSVWRDVRNDWGTDLLAAHYAMHR